jgi:hypothetical protein
MIDVQSIRTLIPFSSDLVALHLSWPLVVPAEACASSTKVQWPPYSAITSPIYK